MKKIKGLVIGGIENKIFNLILITVLLLFAVNAAAYLYNGSMLSQLAGESGQKQQAAITEITSATMDEVVTRTLERSNRTEAVIADGMFDAARDRVAFLADYAALCLTAPDGARQARPIGADAAREGGWTAQVIYADGVDPSDPVVTERVARLGELSEVMIAMCPAFGAANMYIALPEGIHLSVNDEPESWIVDGKTRSYDPRVRNWYRQAVEAGGLVFTEGEYDANTGAYCIECAAPVYAQDGSLLAVVGTDLYLDDMQRVMRESALDGEYQLLVNRSGRAVLAPQAEAFPMADADREGDLRDSDLALLAQIATNAIQGNATGVRQGDLLDGAYYITASPIEATGWVLISAYSQETAGQPATLLVEKNRQIQEEAAAAYSDRTEKANHSTLLLLIAVTVLVLALALVLGKRIVKPLNTITRRVSELGEDNLEFKMEDAFRTGDEVEAMAQSFADLSHKTVEYLDTVKRVTAEKERIGTELALATRIQADMLPHVFPPFPDRREFDLFATMDPAKEVGGDFFDYFLVDSDHLCMVMADVSGKGVPAALFMMACKIILANNAMMGKSPAQVLTDANAAICSNNHEEMFVTVWLGILEISTGRLTAASAGHEYPAIKRANGSYELFKDRHGFVIGGMTGVRYKEYEIQMAPGDRLFLYTDGVPEATNADNTLFGTDRMLEALNRMSEAPPVDVITGVQRAVDEFVGNAEQFDDLTMLCIEYRGGGKAI